MTVFAACLAVYAGLITLWGWDQRRAARVASERLLAAWKDGYVIPPEPAIAPLRPDEESPEFPPPLMDWLSQWDGEEAQAKWAAKARALLREHNGDVRATLNALEAPTY